MRGLREGMRGVGERVTAGACWDPPAPTRATCSHALCDGGPDEEVASQVQCGAQHQHQSGSQLVPVDEGVVEQAGQDCQQATHVGGGADQLQLALSQAIGLLQLLRPHGEAVHHAAG